MYTLCILCTHYNHVPICTHECVRCSLFLLLLNIQYIFGLWFISVAFISLSLCVCVCVWFLFGLHLRMLQYLGFLSRNLYAYHHRRSLYRCFSSSPSFSFFLIIEVPALWTAPLSHHSLSPWTFFARAFFNSFDLSLHFHLARSLTLSDFACACLVALLSLTTRMHALSRIVVVAALSFDYLEANALRWPES